MTLEFLGNALLSEVKPSSTTSIRIMGSRKARNDHKRSIPVVERVRVEEISTKVTRSNIKAAHWFFTSHIEFDVK